MLRGWGILESQGAPFGRTIKHEARKCIDVGVTGNERGRPGELCDVIPTERCHGEGVFSESISREG